MRLRFIGSDGELWPECALDWDLGIGIQFEVTDEWGSGGLL